VCTHSVSEEGEWRNSRPLGERIMLVAAMGALRAMCVTPRAEARVGKKEGCEVR